MRAVLLIRPDIFESLGLQNQNTKIRDNSVFLDWRTEYSSHRTSDLFRVTDHLIGSQQAEELELGNAWDHYFPWDAPNVFDRYDTPTSFIAFLRWSYYRPRDIITMLAILQGLAREAGRNGNCFAYEHFNDARFKRRYSDYLLGEIKDHLTFYYGNAEYELFLNFFVFLRGRDRFSYSEYVEAFANFRSAVGREVAAATSRKIDHKMVRYHSGPKGGDIEIATAILYGFCDVVIFFVDPLRPHPHIEDIRVVFQACMVSDQVVMITNEIHAREFMGRVVRGNDLLTLYYPEGSSLAAP